MIINVWLMMVLFICVVTDLYNRKIYNVVVFPGFVISLLLNVMILGREGIALSLLGCLTGIGILLVPFMLGGMGAGDVKLLGVIGAAKGASFVLLSSIYMALVGAFMAAFAILLNWKKFHRAIYLLYSLCGWAHGVRTPIATRKEEYGIPYGIAIAAGSILAYTQKEMGW
jgi:prepilin peptidase CpaA